MTLYANALQLIRTQLEALTQSRRVNVISIGRFTPQQHNVINALRDARNFELLIDPTILFMGKHLFNSRIVRDGYTIDDVVDQIASAFAPTSEIVHAKTMTLLRSTVGRADRYGNIVLYEVVFELTQRKPKAELFSVVPKNDFLKPRCQK